MSRIADPSVHACCMYVVQLSQEQERLSLEQSSLKANHSRDLSSLKGQHRQQLEMERLV